MSSASRYGYALRISSRERPAASRPITMPTVTRSPRIQALPPMTAGSSVMRVRFFIVYLLRSTLFFSEQQIHHPAAAHMNTGFAAVVKDVGVIAAGVFQRVRQNWQALKGTFIVHGLSDLPHCG